MSIWRAQHTASLLPDGRVMVAGSLGALESTEIFDASSGTWMEGRSMGEARYLHTATSMSDSQVLLAGGQSTDKISNTTEIYVP